MIDIKAIRARLAAATPGPWEVADFIDDPELPSEPGIMAREAPGSYQGPDGTWHGDAIARGMDGPTREANADLIAHAPDDLRALCDEVERLQAEGYRHGIQRAIGMVETTARRFAELQRARPVAPRQREIAENTRTFLALILTGLDTLRAAPPEAFADKDGAL